VSKQAPKLFPTEKRKPWYPPPNASRSAIFIGEPLSIARFSLHVHEAPSVWFAVLCNRCIKTLPISSSTKTFVY
jgi:hypothetical protein